MPFNSVSWMERESCPTLTLLSPCWGKPALLCQEVHLAPQRGTAPAWPAGWVGGLPLRTNKDLHNGLQCHCIPVPCLAHSSHLLLRCTAKGKNFDDRKGWCWHEKWQNIHQLAITIPDVFAVLQPQAPICSAQNKCTVLPGPRVQRRSRQTVPSQVHYHPLSSELHNIP